MTIRFDLGHDLDLEFSRSNIELAISRPKMVLLPQNEKQTYWLNSRPQMWPVGLIFAMILTLNFLGQKEFELVIHDRCRHAIDSSSFKRFPKTFEIKCKWYVEACQFIAASFLEISPCITKFVWNFMVISQLQSKLKPKNSLFHHIAQRCSFKWVPWWQL